MHKSMNVNKQSVYQVIHLFYRKDALLNKKYIVLYLKKKLTMSQHQNIMHYLFFHELPIFLKKIFWTLKNLHSVYIYHKVPLVYHALLSCHRSFSPSLTVAFLTLGGEYEAVELTAQEVSLLFQVFNAFLKPRVLFQRNLQLCA